MKAFAAFLVISVSAVAGPSDPGETAVRFLEKVRSNKINLEPGGDTALSPQTSPQKRKEIARRLERLARDLGRDSLEVGEVKQDDDLAAVLVRKSGGYDPSRLQVFPVALVKRGTEWTAAPVPASFENAGVGYATLLRQRLAALEEWMLREQVIDLEHLREQAADHLRQKISASLPPATLRDFTPQQAAERFLSACERQNLPEILGLLGGLSANLPNDWSVRLKATDAAVATAADVKPPWRLLMSPHVLRVIVHQEEDRGSAQVDLVCLDPAGHPARPSLPNLEIIHLSMEKSTDGLWRIDLPANFFVETDSLERNSGNEHDTRFLNAFTGKLAKLYPSSPRATATQTRDALLTALQQGSLASIFRFVRLDGDPKAARDACVRAAQFWWALREPASFRRVVTLGFQEQDQAAAGACQIFSARNPDRLDLRMLYFEKSEAGWLWTPRVKVETDLAFRDWVEANTKTWQDQWQNELLVDCPKLDQIPQAAAPTEADARKVIDDWNQAIRAGDAAAALRLTARSSHPDSQASLLRNLGYELISARLTPHAPTTLGIHRGQIWTAVGTRTVADDQPSFPFYPVLATPAGPRILLEIDLLAAGNRSRDFLNRSALDRLRLTSPPAAEELKKLFTDYQEQVAKPPAP